MGSPPSRAPLSSLVLWQWHCFCGGWEGRLTCPPAWNMQDSTDREKSHGSQLPVGREVPKSAACRLLPAATLGRSRAFPGQSSWAFPRVWRAAWKGGTERRGKAMLPGALPPLCSHSPAPALQPLPRPPLSLGVSVAHRTDTERDKSTRMRGPVCTGTQPSCSVERGATPVQCTHVWAGGHFRGGGDILDLDLGVGFPSASKR